MAGRRSPTPGIPEDVGRIIVALGHPNRLPILMTLEEKPCTLAELVEETAISLGAVKHALKVLTVAGLVSVREDRAGRNLTRFVYSARGQGWRTILAAVEAVGESIGE
jgi:DNA-binding transcriptional ArsR family regulator